MRNFINKFYHAFVGIGYCYYTQSSFRIQLLGVFLFLYLQLVFPNKENLIIGLSLLVGILSLELINTAIEELCNYICKSLNVKIKIIKDLSSGAVLILCTFFFGWCCFTYIPKIFNF